MAGIFRPVGRQALRPKQYRHDQVLVFPALDLLDKLPRKDPWGEDYLYWSDGLDYLIVSTSRDKRPDLDYPAFIVARDKRDWLKSELCGGRSAQFDADLVWVDGGFCQWFREGGTP